MNTQVNSVDTTVSVESSENSNNTNSRPQFLSRTGNNDVNNSNNHNTRRNLGYNRHQSRNSNKGHGPKHQQQQNQKDVQSSGGTVKNYTTKETAIGSMETKEITEDSKSSNNEDICFICADPILYHALGDCNHRTCHYCALRLRALYKNRNCAYCKVCGIHLI